MKFIDQLFENGQSISVFPLRLIFIKSSFKENISVKAGVTVSKRKFKNATDRNYIKRLMREAYRINKDAYFNNMTTQYALMILYIGNDVPDLISIESKMKKLFEQFLKTIP